MITVFGSINLDLIGTVRGFPGRARRCRATAFSTAPGGKGANQALAAARAGAMVRMVGAVGKDGFAGTGAGLAAAGGRRPFASAWREGPTGIALILVDATGENVIAVIPGANGTLSAKRTPTALEFHAG